MALQGTHIKFAIDLQDYYSPSNLQSYIAGAVYPDTRYITKTPRNLTHPSDFDQWDINTISDFAKGWHSHLACDEIQSQIYIEKFSSLFSYDNMHTGDDDWVSLTAVKILQDLNDIANFKINEFLPDVKFAELQNGESRELIDKFYALIQNSYSNPNELSIESYHPLLVEIGLPFELATRVTDKASEFSKDDELMERLNSAYAEMIDKIKNA